MRDAHGRFVKGNELAKQGGYALQKQIAALRAENDRLRLALMRVGQAIGSHDAGLMLDREAVDAVRAILQDLEGGTP